MTDVDLGSQGDPRWHVPRVPGPAPPPNHRQVGDWAAAELEDTSSEGWYNLLMTALFGKRWSRPSLIVLPLLVLGLLLLHPSALRAEENRSTVTRMKMSELRYRLNDYKTACGQYPKSLSQFSGFDDLTAEEDPKRCKKWDTSQIKRFMIQDAWGHDFSYTSDGKTYRLSSEGEPKLIATEKLEP